MCSLNLYFSNKSNRNISEREIVANAVLKAVTSKNPTMRYLAGKEANAQL